MSRLVKGGAGAAGLVALAVAVVGSHEGLRLTAYRDIVGVPTVCYGETRGVRMGQSYTKPQCDAMLLKALDEFARGVERCAKQPMGDKQYVAHLSLAYNIGINGYCKSTVVRLHNAGDRRGSCRAFMMWNKAGGREIAGLTRRRAEERDLCLEGL